MLNNTIVQATGSAVSVSGSASNARVENNILVSSGGPAILVSADSESGFYSDYNLFDTAGGGSIGEWEGLSYGEPRELVLRGGPRPAQPGW